MASLVIVNPVKKGEKERMANKRKKTTRKRKRVVATTPKPTRVKRRKSAANTIANPVRKARRKSSARRSYAAVSSRKRSTGRRRSGVGAGRKSGILTNIFGSNISDSLMAGAVGGVGAALIYYLSYRFGILKKNSDGKIEERDRIFNHVTTLALAAIGGVITDKFIPGASRSIMQVMFGAIIGGYVSDKFLEKKGSEYSQDKISNQWNFSGLGATGYNPYLEQYNPYAQPQPIIPQYPYNPYLYGKNTFDESSDFADELKALENKGFGVIEESTFGAITEDHLSGSDEWQSTRD